MFKQIPNYPNYYINEKGEFKSIKKGKERMLKPSVHKSNGSIWLAVANEDGTKNLRARDVVAQLFIDNPNNYTVVVKKDVNNPSIAVGNVEWISDEEDTRRKALASLSDYPVGSMPRRYPY